MLFTTSTIENKEIEAINNFFNEFEAVETVEAEAVVENLSSTVLTDLVLISSPSATHVDKGRCTFHKATGLKSDYKCTS